MAKNKIKKTKKDEYILKNEGTIDIDLNFCKKVTALGKLYRDYEKDHKNLKKEKVFFKALLNYDLWFVMREVSSKNKKSGKRSPKVSVPYIKIGYGAKWRKTRVLFDNPTNLKKYLLSKENKLGRPGDVLDLYKNKLTKMISAKGIYDYDDVLVAMSGNAGRLILIPRALEAAKNKFWRE